jgi:capsular exopolysaccharide synthesis family protein
MRRLGVVSASQGEGKTTLALGLARAFALDPRTRVLLIEADLRRPAVDRSLGVEVAAEGLLQYLQGSERTVTLRRLVREGFYVLSAGPQTANLPDLLATPRMAALMDSAQKAFDYVVVDCPPLVPVADSLILQDLLDGFIFVVRSRHAPRETVEQAIGLLKPDRICGLVFNAHRDFLPGYHDYAYRRYRAT